MAVDVADVEVDLVPFVLELSIVDKELGSVKLRDVVHPAQLDLIKLINYNLNHEIPTRVVVLKARQIGISTIIEALHFTMAFMLPRLRGLVLAHEIDSSKHLLEMTQNYFDTFVAHDAYTQKNQSATVLSWVETKSQIKVATAKNKSAGRSRTIHFLHASEVAFWPYPREIMTGLEQTVPSVPRSFIFIESTANGVGDYFHQTWNEACNGGSDYIPRFYPWWTHPEYLGSKVKWPAITGALNEEERKLVLLMRNPPLAKWNDYAQDPIPDSEILDRLTWRRYAIRNKCQNDIDKFHQEYPSTPDEAFLSTGSNVFPAECIDACYFPDEGQRGEMVREGDKARFQALSRGDLRVYTKPKKGRLYLIAGDAKRSLEGDYACAQVLDRHTWEQVAVYRARTDNVTFGEIMMLLGTWYNNAVLVPETEGGGYGTIAVLLDRGYPRVWRHKKAERFPGQVDNSFGWSTNWKTKSQALGNLKKAIVDKMVFIRDRTTHDELVNYVSLPGGKFGNGAEVDHDDTVMALAIAITACIYEAGELISYQEPGVSGEPTFTPPKVKRVNEQPLSSVAANSTAESNSQLPSSDPVAIPRFLSSDFN